MPAAFFCGSLFLTAAGLPSLLMSVNSISSLPYRKQLTLSNGSAVSYTDEGSGLHTIVFLHGLATYGGTWRPNIEGLKGHFRCIAIDLPGNGYSDKREDAYGIQFYAACVYDFIRLLQLEHVVLCGHSMGGQVALSLLLNAPDAAERLVLCAPAGFEVFSGYEQTMYRSAISFADLFSPRESSMRNSIYSSFYHNPAQADGIIDELAQIIRSYPAAAYHKMVASCVNSMMAEPVYERLGEINTPCLVLFGEMDGLIPNRLLHPGSTADLAKKGVSRMPHAHLEMIGQAGHFVQWEQAAAVNKLISEFIGF